MLSVVAACFLSPAVIHAQLQPRLPDGKHELAVRGWFQGQEMEPWEAEYAVADTVMGGRAAIRVFYNSRRVGDRWAYQYTAVWTPNGDVAARWMYSRPQPSSCELAATAGSIAGTSSSGEIPGIAYTGVAIPDFALAAYVATLPLEDGREVKLTVFRCAPGTANNVVVNQFSGTVRSAEARRGWGDAEPAWIIDGSKDYPARVTVAKSDRVVLHAVTVQGSVGHSEDSYVGTSRDRK